MAQLKMMFLCEFKKTDINSELFWEKIKSSGKNGNKVIKTVIHKSVKI